MMIVVNKESAWNLANRLFPTDYELDDYLSEKAGYPIYFSTVKGVNAWISDLGCRLELNYPSGKSENIHIKQVESICETDLKGMILNVLLHMDMFNH